MKASYDVWRRDANALRRHAEGVLRFLDAAEKADQHARLGTTTLFTRPMTKIAERCRRRWEQELA